MSIHRNRAHRAIQPGLPADDDIQCWVLKLQLCLAAIDAHVEYGMFVCGIEYTEEEVREMKAPYTSAIAALGGLLENGTKEKHNGKVLSD